MIEKLSGLELWKRTASGPGLKGGLLVMERLSATEVWRPTTLGPSEGGFVSDREAFTTEECGHIAL